MPSPKKSTAEQLDALRRKQEKLRAQLERLETRKKAEDRKQDARRKIIIGAAVLAHAEHNPGFRDALREALAAAVTRPVDQAAIADLLGG